MPPIYTPLEAMETGISFCAAALRIRADLVRRNMPGLSAYAALLMMADELDGGTSAMEAAGVKSVPMLGIVTQDGRVVSDICLRTAEVIGFPGSQGANHALSRDGGERV